MTLIVGLMSRAAARRRHGDLALNRRAAAGRAARRLTGPDGRAAFDALVMAAAVADFRPVSPAETKLTRGDA